MNVLLYIIQKEFIQIIRNKALLIIMVAMPIVQLLLLANAASNDVKNVNLVLVDQDQSQTSRLLKGKIEAANEFSVVAYTYSNMEAMSYLQANKADIVLQIPNDFEKQYLRGESPKLQMLVNAINGQQALVGSGYLNNIIGSFNGQIIEDIPIELIMKTDPIATVQVVSRNWYNPELEYTQFMAPGILAEITALLAIVLTAMNIVRERELGTIEQINVTPIKKWQFILGKMIPFLILCLVILIIGIVASKLMFAIPIRGSLALIFGYATVNLIAFLGFGLLISNFAGTQQQAIFIAFFFILIFILMCGLFTPIESMPKWAQYLTIPNPLAHFISVSRKVLMKGSGLGDIKMEFLYTFILAIVFNSLAIWSYKKQS